MTDKTEAQPEALRLAEALYAESDRQSTGVKYSTAKKSAAELRRLHADIQQLKAQLSARQAAPNGWRLVPVEPDTNMKRAAQKALMDHSPHREWLEEEWPDGLRMWNGMLSAAPSAPEPEQLAVDGRYTITIECGAAQARFVITEMQIESAPSPAEYVGHAVSKAIAAIDKRRVSHGIGATND